MKLPNSFTTVTPLSKTLAMLLFVSLPFIGFILGINYQKTTVIPPSITLPTPTPRIETNLPTKSITPIITSVFSSTLLNSLEYKYDKNKFTVTKGTTITLDNKNINTLSFSSLEFSKPVLKIFDLSSVWPPVDSLNKLFFFAGGDYSTTIRPVTVGGKTYKFTRQTFAEGFPVEGEGGCFQGGGYHDDYLILDNKLGFLVNSSFSESGCGEESKKINTPNPQTLEDAIKIIESVSY